MCAESWVRSQYYKDKEFISKEGPAYINIFFLYKYTIPIHIKINLIFIILCTPNQIVWFILFLKFHPCIQHVSKLSCGYDGITI